MKLLLNTLYVTSEDIYLSLDGENIVAKRGQETVARYPIHTISDVISFSYAGASPALMGVCAERNIGIAFCTPRGKFLARTVGESNGNVLLRRTQYRQADQEKEACLIARNMLAGKLYNGKWVLERVIRDHPERINEAEVRKSIQIVQKQLEAVRIAENIDSLRGYEGVAASAYFAVFDQMILRDKKNFYFRERTRRPPLDNINVMLSFAYTILANECGSALESVGLDSYVGFLHCDRPGRRSLALDIMEELRPAIADRQVLAMVNNRVIQSQHFARDEQGGIRFTDQGRKIFIKTWQERKAKHIKHPFLNEHIPWGLVPYVQALLLARYLRGDLNGYPPFLWK